MRNEGNQGGLPAPGTELESPPAGGKDRKELKASGTTAPGGNEGADLDSRTAREPGPGRDAKAGPPVRSKHVFRHPMTPFLELIKARLSGLVLATTAVGYVMGSTGPLLSTRFLFTLLGTGLAAAGANAMNEWIERFRDGRMDRTRERPLPAERMTPRLALSLALGMAMLGVVVLGVLVNLLTAALGAFVILLYVLVYTPLKHRTPLCTLFGAVCGAIPPMMGFSGATGALSSGAWILALTLFLWQIPHFLSLAWLYREDYLRGGFRMLPAVDPTGRLTAFLVVLYTLALLPLGIVSLLAGVTGWIFLAGSLLLGSAFFVLGFALLRERTERRARRVFLASLLYLPLLLVLFVADRGPVGSLQSREARLERVRPVAGGEFGQAAPEPAAAVAGAPRLPS